MKSDNEQNYEKRIPLICQFRTVQEHKSILGLCWSLANKTTAYQSDSSDFCKGCPLSFSAKRLKEKKEKFLMSKNKFLPMFDWKNKAA